MKSVLTKAAPDKRDERVLRPDLLERYECGPVQFSGDPNASYDRHLVLDHVVRPDEAAPRERFEALARSLRDLLAQRWLKTARYLRPREPQAGLLPLDGVPHRPVAVEQPPQPPRGAVRARGDAKAGCGARPVRRGGAGRRARQRRPRPAGRLLRRLDGHARDPGDRVRPAVRVRDLPPGDPGRPPGGAPRQLAPPARPVGGRPPRGGGGRPRQLRDPAPRRGSDPHRRLSDHPSGAALRPAGRRLRREDGQHAAGSGGRRRRTPSTSPSSAAATSSAPCTTRSRPRA